MPQALVYSLLAAIFGVTNGLVHVAADALIDKTTVRALIIAVITATITGIFGLAIALVQRKSDDRIHDRLDTMEERQRAMLGAVGANKRSTDPDGGQESTST